MRLPRIERLDSIAGRQCGSANIVAVQTLEGYVLTPMLQRRSVSIPPALGILAVVGLGALFGTCGVLFATPLLLVIMILVRMLRVEDALGDRPVDPS